MKIMLISFLEFSELPPATSLLSTLLDLGHSVSVVTLAPEQYLVERYGKRLASYAPLLEAKPKNIMTRHSKAIVDRVLNRIYHFQNENVERSTIRKGVEKLPTYIRGNDLVWVLHEYTAKYVSKHVMGAGVPYYFTVYELDNNSSHNKQLISFGRHAQKVIVPEYCRAHILKAWWQLDKLPEIIPNKPSEDLSLSGKGIENSAMRQKMERLNGKKVILYQGIFLPERKLDTFAEAIADLGDDYVFAVMGHDNIHLQTLLKKYPGKIEYLGFANPPEHLEITSKAYIGILTYIATSKSINPLFCAPNKIYEYAKFGVPMIGNDIPGLRYSILTNHMGECVDIDDKEMIIDAIHRISHEYDTYSKNAKEFFAATDLPGLIERAVRE